MFTSQTVKATVAALSLLAAENLVSARCSDAADCAAYPEFAGLMASRAGDYTWVSHDVVTDDGYELVLFQITGDSNGDEIKGQAMKGSLLMQHGFSSSGLTWFSQSDPSRPAIVQQLFDDGWSVFIANARGSFYSKGHNDFVPTTDVGGVPVGPGPDYKAYWDFDNDDFAEKDIPAFMEKVQELNGWCKKTTVLAHSAGANYVLNSLSKSSRAHKYISQSINLEPCMIAESSEIVPGGLSDFELYGFTTLLDSLNIWSVNGPFWDAQKAAICLVNQQICDALELVPANIPEFGVKQTEHITQNDNINDWQAFSNFWLFPWTRNTPDIRPQDVDERIAVRFLWANDDELCIRQRQEDANLLRFPSYDAAEDQFIDGPHSSSTSRNDAEFYNKLTALLDVDAGEKMSRRECRRDFNFGI